MITTHVETASQAADRINDAADGQIGLNSVENAHAIKLTRTWIHLRNNAVITAVSTQVMAFHYWISDPPMTDRDRNKQYIIETRKDSKRRRLAGR